MVKKKIARKKEEMEIKFTKKRKTLTRRQKMLRIVAVTVCCIGVLALILAGVVYAVFHHYYGKTDYVADVDVSTLAAEELSSLQEEDQDEDGDYYVRKDVTNEAGEVVGSTYDKVNLDELSDEEKESVKADVQQELDEAGEEQQKALEQIASGQPYVPPTTEQNEVITIRQDDIDQNGYGVEKNEQGAATTIIKDGNRYDVVSSNENGEYVVVKNDGVNYDVIKDENDVVVGVNKNDQTYSVSQGEEGNLEVSAPTEETVETTSQEPLVASDVYNILLIGTDKRPDVKTYGRSDTMILISINYTKKTINMISFMRDLYADIPGVGVNKLNFAYTAGAGPLLVQTIESNYGVHIDNYAAVNFYSLIDIVDSLGGLNVDVSADEAAVANNYIKEMSNWFGMSAEENYITSSGNLHLNGVQTVGYCRIRYVGYMDFDRTERQRRVLITMASTLRSRNVTEINNFLNTALPKVTHNISSDTLASLLMNASTYLGYSINTYRVPFDGQYHYSGEILVPDFTYTIGTLYNIIYY